MTMREITLLVPDGTPRGAVAIQDAREYGASLDWLQERIADLEFALEDAAGWELLDSSTKREFSREGLRKIIHLARLAYLKNPIIRRGCDVQANYVFGQGVEFEAADVAVKDVVDAFLDDPKNRAEFSSHAAMTTKEIDLACEGNIFFVHFTDPVNGAVRVRSLPVDEINDIQTNPEDAKEPWFYHRMWVEVKPSGNATKTSTYEALYPDIDYNPRRRVPTRGNVTILWDQPVQHIKVGGLSTMKFGVPEVYPALDWAKAYKNALEDDATRSAALARFATKLTTTGTAAGMAAAKAKLQTTFGDAPRTAETNPPPLAGSTFIGRRDPKTGNMITDLEPVNLSGTMLDPDHARPIRLMAMMALGLPETFFSDAKVGNHATAKTLDRPTELMMTQRRMLWGDEYQAMLQLVVRKAIQAPRGPLKGRFRVIGNGDDQPFKIVPVARENGELVDPTLKVTWPPLLEHDVTETVSALVAAATLGGHAAQPVLGMQEVARMLLGAFGVQGVDEKIVAWFGDVPDALPEPPPPPAPFGAPPVAGVKEAWMAEFMTAIKEAMAG